MKVYFIRHGESMSNKNGLVQDDTPQLSPKGIDQVNKVAKRIHEDIPVDLVISSTAQRAVDTTKIICKANNAQYIVSDLFAERKQPRSIIGLLKSDNRVIELRRKINRNIHDPFFEFDGVENFYTVRARVFEAMRYLESLADKHEHVVVVTHSVYMRLFFGAVMFGSDFYHNHWKPLMFLGINNTGITVYQILTERERPKWKLISWNDHAHLPK